MAILERKTLDTDLDLETRRAPRSSRARPGPKYCRERTNRPDGPPGRNASLGGTVGARLLQKLASAANRLELRSAATAALCSIDTPVAARYAADLLSGPQGHELDPTEMITAFLARKAGAEVLASALGDAEISPRAAERCSQVLSSAGRTDESLVRVLNEARGVGYSAEEYSPRFVAALAAEALEKGDAARGELVFRSRRANCYSCHKIGIAGGWMGPDLSSIGTTLSLERIAEEVLWPGRNVKEGFSLLQVVTIDGGIYQGYEEKEREDGDEDSSDDLLLEDLVTRDERRIPLADIVARAEGGTAMPSGLTQGFSRTELRDLLRFLSRLGAPGPFTVSRRPILRRWEVLTKTPDGLASMDAGAQGRLLTEGSDLKWEPVYSRVSGVLELSDLQPRRFPDVVRTWFHVERGGPCRLHLNSARGLRVWWNELPLEIGSDTALDLEAGDHYLSFMIDGKARAGKGLFAEWQEVEGSSASVHLD